MHPLRWLGLLTFAMTLSACEDGRVDVALSADRPAVNAQSVVVTVDGITLQRADNSEDRIDLKDPVRIDLLDYDTAAFSLLDNESLDAGDYTGISLRLRENDSGSNGNDYIIDNLGGQRPLDILGGDRVEPLVFKVKKNGGKSFTLELRMDLRLSLAANGQDRSLRPALRAVRTSKAASVSGSVSDSLVRSASCRGNRTAGVGVAVYAFAGSDIEPDDDDGSVPDPIASAPVLPSGSNNWSYRIGTLPAGDYTFALTCDGDREDAVVDNDDNDNQIDFVGDARNINLDDGDDKDLDFPG